MIRAAAILLALAPMGAAADFSVHVKRVAEAMEVEAQAQLQADVPTAWQVLSDYGRLAEFIPDMRVSRVLARDGNRVEVEQKGEARVLFIGFPIEVRLAVVETPPEMIVSRAIAGNFREMRGQYRLERRDDRLMLFYTGRLVPAFQVPPLVGPLILRNHVERTFRALVEEIDRRARAAEQPAREP